MRRLRYQVAASLDGYIAGPNGEFDWIPTDPEIDFTAMWAAYDTLVMGRKTFEASLTAGGGFGKSVQVVVYSTTLDPAKHKKVTVVQTDAAVCPILLGGGIPLLPTPAAQAKLSLTRHKVYQASGIVLLEYAVVR